MRSLAESIKAAPGLDDSNADAVVAKTEDPAFKAGYDARELKRRRPSNVRTSNGVRPRVMAWNTDFIA